MTNTNDCLICDGSVTICPGPTIRSISDADAHFGAKARFSDLLGTSDTLLKTGDEGVWVEVREVPTEAGSRYMVGYRYTPDIPGYPIIWDNLYICHDRYVAACLAALVHTAYTAQLAEDVQNAAYSLKRGNVDNLLWIGHNRPYPDKGGFLPFMDKVHKQAMKDMEDTLDEVGDSWT